MDSSRTRVRQYRSRKEKPCDLCRRRRVCCVRDQGGSRCSLCRTRDVECTYLSQPTPRRHGASDRREGAKNTSPVASGSPDSQHTLQYIGLSGDQDPHILMHSTWNRRESDGIEWACRRVNSDPAMPEHFTIFPDQHLDNHPHYYPANKTDKIAGPCKTALLKSYFSVVHLSYPILDEGEFDEKNASAILLASMYALAHPFCPQAQKINPWQFLDFNGSAIPLEARSAKLETVAAALLYSQRHTYVFRAPTMPGLTAEIGSLVGMSHDVGLNVDPTPWDIPASEKRYRKRLWWAVHMQDKWTALTLGRPSYLNDDQSSVPMITLSDFGITNPLETPSNSTNKLVAAQMFIAMANLSLILSRILSTFYTIKAVYSFRENPNSEEVVETLAAHLREQLDAWRENHLLAIRIRPQTFPDPTGALYLAYYTTEIILCRAVLRNHTSQAARARGTAMVLNVLELVRSLQVSRLRAFWWSLSKVNFAIAGSFMLSMLLISTDDGEAEIWISHIKEYQTLLREQSVGFDVTRLASIRMDLLSKIGRRDEENMATNDGGVTPDLATGVLDHVVPMGSTLPMQEPPSNDESDPINSFMRQNPMGMDPFTDNGNLDWLADLTFLDEWGGQQMNI